MEDGSLGSDRVRQQWQLYTREVTQFDRPAARGIKWAAPALFAAFGFYLQSVGLHYATYSYVHQMNLIHHRQRIEPKYATLHDVLEQGPAEHIDLGTIDSAAMFFPMFFVCVAAIKPHKGLQVWVKVMICAGFLFSLKGMMGAATTVPDSIGWEMCKERLKPAGFEWMSADHSLGQFFTLDFMWVMSHGSPLRYCSDMMYSGHTFVVTLFALGSYELLRIVINPIEKGEPSWPFVVKMEEIVVKAAQAAEACWFRRRARDGEYHGGEDDKKKAEATYRRIQFVALSLFTILAIAEQCIEIYLVLKSHFHYTMDVIVALLVTFLFFTNGSIAIASKQWELRGLELVFQYINFKNFKEMLPENFTRMRGCLEKFDAYADKNLRPQEEVLQLREGFEGENNDLEIWRKQQVWVSKGDSFTPLCCVPCCCFAGRSHLYSDTNILSIALATNTRGGSGQGQVHNRVDLQSLDSELNLGEGLWVSEVMFLLTSLWSWCRGLDEESTEKSELAKNLELKWELQRLGQWKDRVYLPPEKIRAYIKAVNMV